MTAADRTHLGGHLLIQADAAEGIPLSDNSIDLCLCSPPYLGLRQYQGVEPTNWPAVRFAPMPGVEPVTVPAMTCTLGNEPDPHSFVGHLVHVFRDVRRVLNAEGVVVCNMGDGYNTTGSNQNGRGLDGQIRGGNAERGHISKIFRGLADKQLFGIPWRLAFALQADSWLLRSAPPWIKPDNAMPESVQSRPGTAHEMIFILAKSDRYYWDADAVRRPTAPSTLDRDRYTRITNGKDGPYAVRHDHETPSDPAGRNWRTADIFMDALDECIAFHRGRAAELEAARDRGGMIVGGDGEGEAAAILANPQSFKGAHFATWGGRLITPFIRAATSEAGHCSACGRGLRRAVERGKSEPDRSQRSTSHYETSARYGLTNGGNSGFDKLAARMRKGENGIRTLGWSPACSCSAPARPAVVLDPFGGSMSTVVAALALGRSAIGIDASLDYIKMGKARIDRPHARVVANGQPPAPLPLFPEDEP